MKRLLPLRDYDDHDVINLFAVTTPNSSVLDTGNGDSGVIVAVSNGEITEDAVTLVSASYLGKTDYPYVGRDYYPTVSLTVAPAGTGSNPIGITLYETAMYDENGEKLIYYRQKALENQITLSGQAVPVATKGLFTLDQTAFVGGVAPAAGGARVRAGRAGPGGAAYAGRDRAVGGAARGGTRRSRYAARAGSGNSGSHLAQRT